jgi:diguanylate cyclase (GGDEF)-like protein
VIPVTPGEGARDERRSLDGVSRWSYWAAAACGLLAALLIHGGAIDAARSALIDTDWQLDELFFVILAAGAGAMVANRVTDRLKHRSRALWADDLANRDPLTGLFNRRGLDEIARRSSVAEHARLLLLADFDGFKEVNDTHGHRTGDEVLRSFAERLAAVRGTLVELAAVRLGGDEFVLVASGEPDAICAAFSEQVLCPIRATAPDGSPFEVSVSAGLTRWLPDAPLETALDQADVAMYEAKRTGAGLCRFDRLSEVQLSSPRRLKRVFERELSVLPHRNAQICVAAVSLDRYYTAKRALGQDYAARLLRSLRQAMEEHKSGLLIERIAADTLGVLFAAEDIGQATAIVDLVVELCTRLEGPDGAVSAEVLTIGLAGPAPASALRETVERAQFALDEARRTGRKMVVFDLVEQERADQNISLMSEMRHALATDELELHYQPKMASRTGEIDSFEALARWRHPERGAISPAVFVPIAEASGDIEALTYWVIERAMKDWEALEAAGIARPIYVNVSAQLIGAPAFADRLLKMLDGLQGRIGIEITETAVLDNPTHALRHLRQIAAAGIHIAIDDYGVGLSSLSYLKQLPAAELKIDMSFITHLAESHRDPMIVRSTIDLAHGLGLRVTAEGVDKPEVLTLLKIMGCDMIQGYQIAAAMPVDQVKIFMRDHDSSAEHVADCAAQFLAMVSG